MYKLIIQYTSNGDKKEHIEECSNITEGITLTDVICGTLIKYGDVINIQIFKEE